MQTSSSRGLKNLNHKTSISSLESGVTNSLFKVENANERL